MTTWIRKFRLSAALDRSPSPGHRSSRPPDLAAVPISLQPAAEEIASAHALLQAHSQGATGRPVYFHGSIMHAVRAAARAAGRAALARRKWTPAFALAVLVAAGLLWATLHDPPPQTAPGPLESASAALTFAHDLANAAPATIARPMSDEWERVNRDIERTAEFLLSSLP